MSTEINHLYKGNRSDVQSKSAGMKGYLAKIGTNCSRRSYISLIVTGSFLVYGFFNVCLRDVKEPVITEVLTKIIDMEALNDTSIRYGSRQKWKPEAEVRHIAFLKVHKTASSTVLNIMYRFGTKRGLNFILPKYGNYLDLQTPNIIPPPPNQSYDILCNHVRFNEVLFAKFLPRDTFYIGIVREPLDRLHSAFWYYTYVYPSDYLTRISASYRSHTFEKYLENPYRFEPPVPSESHTNNRMAIDFGYDEKHFGNTTLFSSYIEHLDSVFDLVMVTEYFDESVVLLRRHLKWPLKDILYLSQNKIINKPNFRMTSSLLKKVKHFLALDYMLYKHYLAMFQERLKMESEEFKIELKYFKKINKICKDFCLKEPKAEVLYFPETSLSERFNITYGDCALMKKEELDFLRSIRYPNGARDIWSFFATHSEFQI